MSRTSGERITEEEKLLHKLVEKLVGGAYFTKPVSDTEMDFWLELFDWYADEKARLPKEECRKIGCSGCLKEFYWNGQDEGELTRVRGRGLFCQSCLRNFFPVSKEGEIKSVNK